VLCAQERATLRAALAAVEAFLGELDLRLKARATILAPSTQGLPFLGWRVYRGMLRLRPENLRRTRARLRHRAWQFRQGLLDQAALADCTRSVIAHMRHGGTLALRRAWFAVPSTGAGRWLLESCQPRRQLRQPRLERAVCEPQQERTFDPQQQPRSSCRQDVSSPDRGGRSPAPPRRAP
jgi:hypothetical protein